MLTRLSLRVSGKRREILFDKVLPERFVPMSIEGPLPARLETAGTLRVQVRPGTHVLTLTARLVGPAERIVRPQPSGRWPEEEAWVFQAQPPLRVATVSGVPTIDPQQTTLPPEWRSLPAYAVKPGQAVQFVVQRAGDGLPDQLKLDRQIFLDFDGSGYTVTDKVTGQLRRAWRLEMGPDAELGSVAVDEENQLVTIGQQGGRAGIELRQGQLDLTADSRMPFRSTFSAVGWNTDFHEVSGVLHLPPGWQLLHASGADDIPETWLHRYRLMSLFLSLLASMAMLRLFGTRWAVLALFGLLLVAPVTEQPHVALLSALFFEALLRALPPGKLLSVLRFTRILACIGLVLVTLDFASNQMRRALYPAVERPAAQEIVFDASEISTNGPGQEGSMILGLIGSGAGGGGAARSESRMQKKVQRIEQNKLAQDFSRKSALGMDELDDSRKPAKAKPKGKAGKKAMEDEDLDGLLEVTANQEPPSPKRAMVQQQQTLFGKKDSFAQRTRNANFQFDPKAVVQTGPGRPRWSWNRHTITFSGRVEANQPLSLWLIPPWMNLCLALAQVGLLVFLTLRLCGVDALRHLRVWPKVAIVLLLCLPTPAQADFPDKEVLDELKERLLKEPDCSPGCASSSRLFVEAQPKYLRLRMEVSAAVQTAVPLPGSNNQWMPEQVLLDGVPASSLSKQDGERLTLLMPAGNHQVILEGRLPLRPTVQLELPLKSWRVESRIEGWELAGVHEDGVADSNLQLTRIDKNHDEGKTDLQPGTLPPLLAVSRHIQIGLQWEVHTTVHRLTPQGSAVVLEIPLLPGEQVTTPELRVQNRKVLVNMAPPQTSLTWHSSLQETSALELVAAALPEISERWKLQVSPMFHAEWTGLATLRPAHPEAERQPEWAPWPSEKLRIDVSRPEPKHGFSLTVDEATLDVYPGLRSTDARFQLRLRSSQGGQHRIKLAESLSVESVVRDGRQVPVQQNGRDLVLDVTPGSSKFEVKWRQLNGFSIRYRTPEVDLGAPAVNIQMNLHFGGDRWVLLLSGPRLGPAVLFWGQLFVLILVALVLSRVPWTPLRTQHYLLLGFGLLHVSLVSFAVVLGWFVALGYRQNRPGPNHWLLYDLRQVLLVVWMVWAAVQLFAAIRQGLLVCPDMAITGNGSQGGAGTLLRFFADRSPGPLPKATVLSLPLGAYKLVMLLWSLGLAVTLVQFLPWAYRAFAEGGLWRKAPPFFKRQKMPHPIELDRTAPHPVRPPPPPPPIADT